MTYKLYNVDIFDSTVELNAPHFNLLTYQYSEKINDFIEVGYKVTFTRFTTQVEYDNFQSKVFDAINIYNLELRDLASTILFRVLYIYKKLEEIEYQQDLSYDSQAGLRIAKPLAKVYNEITKQLVRKQATGRNSNVDKGLTFRINNKEIEINETDFVDWILETLKANIIHSKYHPDLGDNMYELADALYSKNNERMENLANRIPDDSVIKNSEFLTSFCLNIHRYICLLSKADSHKFNAKQTKFYRSLLYLFEVPGWNRYKLSKGSEVDKKQIKKDNDAFFLLLKRSVSDMVKVI